MAQQIPAADTRILSFLLHFLESEGLASVPIYINGGYIRDMLLGKVPDDLDLSFCLRGCADEVSVGNLLERLPAFASARPAFGVTEVKLATILSNESKDKQLDTFKAHFTDVGGTKTEVDVMPTIGEETYTADSRIPVRDQRGTPEQDTLRRDLTIGALLLRVMLASGGAAAADTSGLCFEFLDFYGGLEDLQKGVLRAPFPKDKTVEQVQKVVLRGPAERSMAQASGLNGSSEADALQVLWWVKVLIDDPLRICRALRIQAKLGFAMHDAFWLATPFALEHLRIKVAGGRKNTEYQKLAGYGLGVCSACFEQAFDHSFGPGKDLRLAPALFGGQDEKGRPKVLSNVVGFDAEGFRHVAGELKDVSSEAETFGALLAVAIATAQLAEGAASTLDEFSRACDGMCVSNATREAGMSLLLAASRMLDAVPVAGSLERGIAAACGLGESELCLHAQMWEALLLCRPRSGPTDVAVYRQRVALLLAQRGHGHLRMAEGAEAAFEVLMFERPPIKGNVLGTPGVFEVPPPLRRQVMVLLEVGLRLLRRPEPLETPEQLQALFSAVPELRGALASTVWFEEDGKTLRPEFKPGKKGKK